MVSSVFFLVTILYIFLASSMNAFELQSAFDAIQQEIDIVVLDQGNHTELSYVLRYLTTDKVLSLLAHIRELRSVGKPVTYELLERAIGEEETDY